MQEFFRNNYNSLKSEFKEETELMTEKRDSLMEKAVCIDGETPFITIGIDHGWSSIKLRNFCYDNGVVQMQTEPALKNNTLFYNGKYYKVGGGRMQKQASKTENENYFLATLPGIAMEISRRGLEHAQAVRLAIGVPLTRYGIEKDAMIDYFMKERSISFAYEGEPYYVYLHDVKVYPQCYAAVASRLAGMENHLVVVDCGSWTLDILPVRDKLPVEEGGHTKEIGLITTIEEIRSASVRELPYELSEDDIVSVMKGEKTNLADAEITLIGRGLSDYAAKVEAELRELKYNPESDNIVYVGGGANIMRKFAKSKGDNVKFLGDVRANAAGYEYLANMLS
jgi:plasmid segregation protein ParM